MRYLYLVIGLIALMGFAYAAGGHFTAPLDVDTFVSKASPDTNFSDSTTLWAASEGGDPTSEVYLSFVNLFGSQGLFSSNNVESATLKLYATEIKKPGIITAYLLHGATSSTATWNDKADYDKAANATISIDKEGSVNVDIMPIIKKAVETCTEGCPYSIVLVANGDASIGFASSENSDREKIATLEYATLE
jgi:hypothetical protein